MTKRSMSILERPVYGVSEAAGLLRLRADRARAWLDGYERQGSQYAPVIRVEPTGEDVVTWGEFVELGYLREYRRKGVPLQRLRPVIDELRREFDTPYPLATAKPHYPQRQHRQLRPRGGRSDQLHGDGHGEHNGRDVRRGRRQHPRHVERDPDWVSVG